MLSIDLDAEPTVEAQNTPMSGTWQVGFQERMSLRLLVWAPTMSPQGF